MDEEYDWGSWDNQASEYLNSDDYTGGQYYFDDAVGNTAGNEYGDSGNRTNYDTNFNDWNYNNGSFDYAGGTSGNLGYDNIDYNKNYSQAELDAFKLQEDARNAGYASQKDQQGNYIYGDPKAFGEGFGWSPHTGGPMSPKEVQRIVAPYEKAGVGFDNKAWGTALSQLFGSGGGPVGPANKGITGNETIDGLLKSLVSGGGGSSGVGINDILRGLTTYLGARDERKNNAEFVQQARDQLNESRAYMDPFHDQRQQYMERLLGASNRLENLYTNPSSDAFYQTAKNEMERRVPRQLSRNRFGMGVNRMMAQEAPSLMAKAAENARQDMRSYITPSGADIKPNGATELAQLLLAGQRNNTNAPYYKGATDFLTSLQNNSAQNKILDYLKMYGGNKS